MEARNCLSWMALATAADGETATAMGKDGSGNSIWYSVTAAGKQVGTKALLASAIPSAAKKGGAACEGTIAIRPTLTMLLAALAAICCAFFLPGGTLW